jgi:hypothetical protein
MKVVPVFWLTIRLSCDWMRRFSDKISASVPCLRRILENLTASEICRKNTY